MAIDPKQVEQEKRREKARWLMYRKPIVKDLNLDTIHDTLSDMADTCYEIHWYVDGEDGNDSLIAALDGDESEAWEFKTAFSDLEAQINQMREDMDEWWENLTEFFDIFFVGIHAGEYAGGYLGYDEIEEDYFHIDVGLQTELAEETGTKKLMAKTKKEIINIAGDCFTVAMNYFSLRHRYDNLSAAIEILRGKNQAVLQQVKEIEAAYDKIEKEGFEKYTPAMKAFDNMVENLPERVWFE